MTEKNKWVVLSKKGKNFENLFISCLGVFITKPNLKRKDPAELISSQWLQGDGNRYFLVEEYQDHMDLLNNFLKDDPEILIKSYEYYLEVLKRIEKSGDKIIKDNFEKADLVKYFLEWSDVFPEGLLLGYNYYWLSQPVSDIIIDILKNHDSKDVFSDFELLSQAEQLSAIQQEKIDILAIVEKIDQNKLKLNSSEVDELINRHLEKYAYLGQYYMRAQPWGRLDVVKRLEDLLKSNWHDEQDKAKDFLNYDKKSAELMDNYNFSDYERQMVRLMKKMSFATNRYDEAHAYFFAGSRKFLKYLAGVLGVNHVELIEMSKQEVLEHLTNGQQVDNNLKKILLAREKESTQLNSAGQSTIWHGSEAHQVFIEEIGEEEIEKANILSGSCACQGRVSGPVVIFESVKDLGKVKEGDIMVARATVPAFVPAMEKAAGIITEMGGLLSHAAIVSREMNVPCVVGVNNATKILKNGDQVEIDAKEGIIKVL